MASPGSHPEEPSKAAGQAPRWAAIPTGRKARTREGWATRGQPSGSSGPPGARPATSGDPKAGGEGGACGPHTHTSTKRVSSLGTRDQARRLAPDCPQPWTETGVSSHTAPPFLFPLFYLCMYLFGCIRLFMAACGLSCSVACGISAPPPGIRTCVPCTGRKLLNDHAVPSPNPRQAGVLGRKTPVQPPGPAFPSSPQRPAVTGEPRLPHPHPGAGPILPSVSQVRHPASRGSVSFPARSLLL